MKLTDIYSVVAAKEGKKVQTPIGQIREIVGIVAELQATNADALKALMTLGARRAKKTTTTKKTKKKAVKKGSKKVATKKKPVGLKRKATTTVQATA